MNREKIIELARQAGFDPHDMSADFTCNLKDIERFAALVEREVRGDAEPTAWIWWKDDPENNSVQHGLTFLRPSEDDSPAITWTPLYTDPPFPYPSHSVVRQLVEALEFCRFSLEPYDDIKPRDWKSDRENLRRAHQQAKAALAAAKKESE